MLTTAIEPGTPRTEGCELTNCATLAPNLVPRAFPLKNGWGGKREGRKDNIPNKRSRYNRYSTSTLEKKVEKSELSIKKLKAHTEKKTCPKDLRYNVRVNIVPDDEFKKK